MSKQVNIRKVEKINAIAAKKTQSNQNKMF
jgi:hypothetical protein